MKIIFAILPLLFLVGCGHIQHGWQLDAWGPAEADVRDLGAVEIKNVEMPKRILGDKEPGEEAVWLRTWPVVAADELADGLSREAEDLGLGARGTRKTGPHVLALVIDSLGVGGSAYSNGQLSGRAVLTRQDGTVVATLFTSWAEGRGMGEPDIEYWFDHLGMQFARWLKEQR